MDTKNLGFDSKLIHAGDFEDANGSAVTQHLLFAMQNMVRTYLLVVKRDLYIHVLEIQQ